MDRAAHPRSTYRHGDLRRVLVEAGLELARAGGPDAVVLREATRRAGVVPNAAYRHFAGRDDLLEAVRFAALARLAEAIEAELARIPRGDPASEARAALRAVGTAYLRFAAAETGLFRTAFATPPGLGPEPALPEKAGASGLNAFQLLGAALDRMAAAGLLPPERRQGAEYLAWSAVHGLALLLIDGPLRRLPAEAAAALGPRVIEMVTRALEAGA